MAVNDFIRIPTEIQPDNPAHAQFSVSELRMHMAESFLPQMTKQNYSFQMIFKVELNKDTTNCIDFLNFSIDSLILRDLHLGVQRLLRENYHRKTRRENQKTAIVQPT